MVAVNGPITTDPTYVFVGPGLWSVIEINLAIIVACLPSMRPLLRFVIHGSLKDTSRRGLVNVPRLSPSKPLRTFSGGPWSRQTTASYSNISTIEEEPHIDNKHVQLAQLDKALPRVPRCDDQIWVDHEVEINYTSRDYHNDAEFVPSNRETRPSFPTADTAGLRTFDLLRQKRSSSLKPPHP